MYVCIPSSHQDLLGKAQDPNCFFSQFSDSDFSGFTALTAASFLGNPQLVELLCQAGGGVRAYIGPEGILGVELWGVSVALSWGNGGFRACFGKSSCGDRCARTLCEAKAALDALDMRGFSALQIAIRRDHADLVQLLLQSRANANLNGTDASKRPDIFCTSYVQIVQNPKLRNLSLP